MMKLLVINYYQPFSRKNTIQTLLRQHLDNRRLFQRLFESKLSYSSFHYSLLTQDLYVRDLYFYISFYKGKHLYYISILIIIVATQN